MQFANDLTRVEVREDICRQYNRELDERHSERAWGRPQSSSWYKNSTGRVSQNWPGAQFEWWQQTHDPNPADYPDSWPLGTPGGPV